MEGYGMKIWRVARGEPLLARIIAHKVGISPLLAQVLINRGVASAEEARLFLHGGISDLYSPFLLPDMEKAVRRLHRALERDEKIVVYGDYDADGVTATYVLLRFLRDLGAAADYYIPDRVEEGYGLHATALKRLRQMGYRLVVTVDCGISALAEAELAAELGTDLIITDHHEVPPQLPRAEAVVNPKRKDSLYPFPHLAGVGVAFKLVQAMVEYARLDYPAEERFLPVVAVGTVADVVPLLGENRILAKHGLSMLDRCENAGLRALLEVSGYQNSRDITRRAAFGLAPRINAAGRIGDAGRALELLLAEDEESAYALARFLEQENRRRQEIEEEILAQALALVEARHDLERERVLVVAGENWHQGVIGIVAARVAERFHRPSVLININGQEGTGSARSVPGFNIYRALASCDRYLTRYGGHEQAAGLTVAVEYIEALRQALNGYALENMAPECLYPWVEIDAEVDLRELSLEVVKELDSLAPFGYGNPRPLFRLKGASFRECREVGNGGGHLKMKLEAGGMVADAIAFGWGELAGVLDPEDRLDVAFLPQLNTWNGHTSVQLKVQEIKPSSQPDNPVSGTGQVEEKTWEEELPLLEKGRENSLLKGDTGKKKEAEKVRGYLAAISPEELPVAVTRLLGKAEIPPLLRETVASLSRQGKLLVQGSPATRMDLLCLAAATTVFVKRKRVLILFPLRSIAKERYDLLRGFMEWLGLQVYLLGERPEEEEFFRRWQQGEGDVALATVEFFLHRRNNFRQGNKSPGLVVMEEFHYCSCSWYGDACRQVEKETESWGACFLALAGSKVEQRAAGIELEQVFAEEMPEVNFRIVDRRNWPDRPGYVSRLAGEGEKTLVLVNTRLQAVELALGLRRKLPDRKDRIVFYHSGLDEERRKRLIQKIEENKLAVIITTPACVPWLTSFPVRHIVLYSLFLNFSPLQALLSLVREKEQEVILHLLYGEAEADILRQYLEGEAPSRENLAKLYTFLKKVAAREGEVSLADAEIAALLQQSGEKQVTPRLVASGLAIFAELGLVEIKVEGKGRRIAVPPAKEKVELESSLRYREGLREKKVFQDCSNLFLYGDGETIKKVVQGGMTCSC